MWVKLIDGPTVEPLTLAQVKLHCRVDETADDTLLTTLITIARRYVENKANIKVITQTWNVTYDLSDFPWSEVYRNVIFIDTFPYARQKPNQRQIVLPFYPMQEVVSFYTVDPYDNSTLFDADNYRLSNYTVKLDDQSDWPVNLRSTDCVQIQCIAGFGDTQDDVPADVQQAMLLLIAHWYENRAAVYDPMNVNTAPTAIQHSVDSLLSPYRLFAI